MHNFRAIHLRAGNSGVYHAVHDEDAGEWRIRFTAYTGSEVYVSIASYATPTDAMRAFDSETILYKVAS